MKRFAILLALLGTAACQDRAHVLAPEEARLSTAATERVGQAKPKPVSSTSRAPQALPSLSLSAATSGLTAANLSAAQMAEALVGSGVQISNIAYSGASRAAGEFSGGGGIVGFDDGILLSSGDVVHVLGTNQYDNVSYANGTPGDSDLNTLTGKTTYDAAVLSFEFVPNADSVYFEYVFASDEYNEFVGSDFDDAFAFFVNGQNCAVTPSGSRVSINTINLSAHPSLYRNNDLDDGGGSIATEMDGLTTTLVCKAAVNNGQPNQLKLVIADASDQAYDSNVFIKAGSFSTTAPTAGSITGVVRDAGTLALLEGVQVSLQNSTLSATTDANGVYTIPNVPVGTYTVQAAKQYFATGSLADVAVVGGQVTTADFALVATHRAVTVNVSASTRCDVTVTARSVTTNAFFVQRAAPTTQCPAVATFVLPVGLAYVFGLHNEVVSDVLDHQVWPNFRPMPTDDLPNRVGAVCIESNGSCNSAPLTPDNVYAAIGAATPLLGDRSLTLTFHSDAQAVVPCTLIDSSYPAQVYVISPLDPAKLGTMPRNTFYPPGIGHYVDVVESSAAGECEIKSVPAGQTVVVEVKDADGDISRAILTPGQSSLVLEEDPDFFYPYYLLDGVGDNASGKDDVTLVTFGTNRNADGTQGDVLLVKADSRAIQDNGTAQFLIEVRDAKDASGAVLFQSVVAKVICSKQKGTCQIAEVTGDDTRWVGLEGHLDANGDGWVTAKFNVTGASSAQVRVRAGVADGYDFAPNTGSNSAASAVPQIVNGWAVWLRTSLPGSSWDMGFP